MKRCRDHGSAKATNASAAQYANDEPRLPHVGPRTVKHGLLYLMLAGGLGEGGRNRCLRAMLVTPMRPAGPSVKSEKVTRKMQSGTNGLICFHSREMLSLIEFGVVSPSNPQTADRRRGVRGRNSGMQIRVSVRSASKLTVANPASCLAAPSQRPGPTYRCDCPRCGR